MDAGGKGARLLLPWATQWGSWGNPPSKQLSYNIGFFTMLEVGENNYLTWHFLLLVHSIPNSAHCKMAATQFWAFSGQGTGKDQREAKVKSTFLDYRWKKLQERQHFADKFSTFSYYNLSWKTGLMFLKNDPYKIKLKKTVLISSKAIWKEILSSL